MKFSYKSSCWTWCLKLAPTADAGNFAHKIGDHGWKSTLNIFRTWNKMSMINVVTTPWSSFSLWKLSDWVWRDDLITWVKGQIWVMIRIIQPPNFSLEINRELIFRGEIGQRKMFFSHLLIFWFLFFFLNNAFSFLSSSEWTFYVYWGRGWGGVGERKSKHSKLCKAFLLYVIDSPLPGRPQAYSVSPSSWAEGLGVGSLAADAEFGSRLQHFLLALMQLFIFGSASFPLVAVCGGYPLVSVCRLLIALTSLVENRL